jgi:hypothetical protein
MLALAPLGVVYVDPNFQAHLSAFSCPGDWASYHALNCGSVTVSTSSCASADTSASTPRLSLGLLFSIRLDVQIAFEAAYGITAYLMM